MGKMIRTLAVAATLFVAYVYADCGTDPNEIPAIAVRQEMCPPSAAFFGFMGCAAALVFACIGAAYGTAIEGSNPYGYASYSGYSALAAGLCCGMAGLSAGIAIGIVGDAGVRT